MLENPALILFGIGAIGFVILGISGIFDPEYRVITGMLGTVTAVLVGALLLRRWEKKKAHCPVCGSTISKDLERRLLDQERLWKEAMWSAQERFKDRYIDTSEITDDDFRL